MRTNADRADEIARVLEDHGYTEGNSPMEALSDLLADAMHYAEREGLSFEDAFQRASMHFDSEQAEEAAS